jgi:cyclopropane fatty-acyl-phospholipid synthase-like methyltransferase
VFWQAMGNVPQGFELVADLGSGSGERLLEVAERHPHARGLGLDIAPRAVDMATGEARRRGLEDRVSFQVADVRGLTPRPEFEEVQLLTSFMMGHDMWPREQCIAQLRRLRELFPNAQRFLLGDTVRTTDVPDDDVPIFTLGFEVGHALMGVYLPTLEEWQDAFTDCGWKLVATHTSEMLAGTVVFELA